MILVQDSIGSTMDIRKFLVLLCLTALSALSFFSVGATKLTVKIEHQSFFINEWVALEVSIDDSVSSNALDLSALKQHFSFRTPSVSNQRSIINGKATRSTTWKTMIRAKRAGRWTIPSLQVNNVNSTPISLLVLPPSSANSTPERSFIKTTVDFEQVYVQQQFIYTVKLYTQERIERGSLTPPEMTNADVQQLGEYTSFSDISNGQRYTVHQWNFAVIAKNSGDFTLSPPLFEGEMIDTSRQSFGMFRSTKPIIVEGENKSIKVKAIPSDIDYAWMPAEFVQLSETWQDSEGNNRYSVGKPITRTLTLTTLGLRQEQLVDIATLYPPSIKVYPDQPELKSEVRDGRLVAQRLQSEAIIPNKAGTFVLPEVKVPWFNIITQQTEYATIAARAITVEEAESSTLTQNTDQTTNSNDVCVFPQGEQETGEENNLVEQTTDETAPKQGSMVWFIVGISGLWLLTLIGWFVHVRLLSRKTNDIEISPSITASNEQKISHSQLMKTLTSQNPKQVLDALTQYLNNTSETGNHSLTELIDTINDDKLSEAVTLLLRAQYQDTSLSVDWSEIETVLMALKNINHKDVKNDILLPLYPTSK